MFRNYLQESEKCRARRRFPSSSMFIQVRSWKHTGIARCMSERLRDFFLWKQFTNADATWEPKYGKIKPCYNVEKLRHNDTQKLLPIINKFAQRSKQVYLGLKWMCFKVRNFIVQTKSPREDWLKRLLRRNVTTWKFWNPFYIHFQHRDEKKRESQGEHFYLIFPGHNYKHCIPFPKLRGVSHWNLRNFQRKFSKFLMLIIS